jgi:hypothetical protein
MVWKRSRTSSSAAPVRSSPTESTCRAQSVPCASDVGLSGVLEIAPQPPSIRKRRSLRTNSRHKQDKMGKIVPADIEGRNGSVPRASDVVARRDALCHSLFGISRRNPTAARGFLGRSSCAVWQVARLLQRRPRSGYFSSQKCASQEKWRDTPRN